MDIFYTDVGCSHPQPKRTIAIGNDGKIIVDSSPKEAEREIFYISTDSAYKAIDNLLMYICRKADYPKDNLEGIQFLIGKRLQQLEEGEEE